MLRRNDCFVISVIW
uniref:Uncharacterized protein n=1 Tax=Arundo donax TaxID=35708 RepID=A0A0A8YG66_ARUDO